MLLIRDHNQGDFEIRSYEPGKLKINEETYQSSLLVGSKLLEPWEPQNMNEITSDSMRAILKLNPTIVLFGTGEFLLFPDIKLLQIFYDQKIGIEVMTTLAACHTFNVLMSEGRNVVGALLIR